MAVDKKYIYAYALKNAVEHSGKAVAGSVISGLFNHGLTKEGIKEIMPELNFVLKEVNSWIIEKQAEEFEKYSEIIGHRPEREGLSELNNVGKEVVMRFAPSPSGLLHIGHAMTGMLSSLYVKKYNGKFYFRIEDTNPENIYAPAYNLLKKEADWIFGNVFKYVIQSDRMKIYYNYVERLLNLEKVYVCTCNSEKFKELVDSQKACPCRILGKAENFVRWKKMLDKKGFKEGKAVVRFKSDLNDSNPAMRDFPLARINLTKHPRQGKKYRVWPLMNLSVCVDDIEFNTTHAIRAKDHRDNAFRQKLIYECLGLKNKFPENIFLGRYNFTDMELSASATTKAIKEGKYSGWEDIRLPSISALKKRGYLPEAFAKMAEQRGISEVDKVISKKDFFEVLDNFNRGILKDKVRKAELVRCSEKEANAKILMPDAEIVFGKTNLKAKNPQKSKISGNSKSKTFEVDEIFYFSKFGYARFNGLIGKGKNAKQIFWFGHE